jgi:hypothetical protein
MSEAGCDTPHGETAAARQYAIDGHNEVNKINPLKEGEAIFYHGLYFDDYLVAEFAAAEQIRAFFDKRFSNIDVFHFVPVTPVPAARNRKLWVLDEEKSIWI